MEKLFYSGKKISSELPFKLTIFITIPWFLPAYKAGGPIQSIANLVGQSEGASYQYKIFTSNTDLDGSVSVSQKCDCWTSFNENTEVYYCSRKNQTINVLKAEIKRIKPDVVFINGIFDWYFNIVPLFFLNDIRKIVSARGMLQPGALKTKPFKKKLFLTVLKLWGVSKKITWHATNIDEAEDIKMVFGSQAKIIVAENIPKQPILHFIKASKCKNKLRLVYLSLIAEKKNLLALLELVLKSGAGITLDIYGPPKDLAYWQKCKQIIEANPGQLQYKGDVIPQKVQETFMQYDASILLTKGENFGHALYESLSAGRPIITSYFTPWNNLEEKNAGWNLDIADEEACIKKLEAICAMNAESFASFCEGAYKLATDYYDRIDAVKSYEKLFGV